LRTARAILAVPQDITLTTGETWKMRRLTLGEAFSNFELMGTFAAMHARGKALVALAASLGEPLRALLALVTGQTEERVAGLDVADVGPVLAAFADLHEEIMRDFREVLGLARGDGAAAAEAVTDSRTALTPSSGEATPSTPSEA
jgi:hypothetical protein